MNCISCQAQLAPRSTHCYFCGAAQQVVAGPSRGAAAAIPSAAYSHWVSSSAPSSEAWRLWASFFLGGLYGPVASRYLYLREEWSSGLVQGQAAPTAPSNRGLVVLGTFIGLPTLFILVLGFVISANEVSWSLSGASWNTDEAHGFTYANIFVAGFYLLSVVAARQIDRRFRLLLYELTAGDQQALDTYRRGRVASIIATVISVSPFILLTWMASVMLWSTWSTKLESAAVLYMFLVVGAMWSTSWLHVDSVSQFRRALQARP